MNTCIHQPQWSDQTDQDQNDESVLKGKNIRQQVLSVRAYAHNPLYTFPRNFLGDGEVANLSLQWNLGNDATQQTRRTFARVNLLRTCYGETGVMNEFWP